MLNITDLSVSRPFYQKALKGFNVIDESDNHVGLSNGLFSVWLADANYDGEAYSGRATDTLVGLHHFAFKVETQEELLVWETYLKEEGIELQDGGITDDGFGGKGLFFTDPDNIRLEIHLG